MSPAADAALLALLRTLHEAGYAFVTPTNGACRIVRERGDKARAASLRDVFGWSLPFDEALVGADLLALMQAAGVLERGEDGWRSAVRVSSLGGTLLLHSAFPTTAADAVFLGPDTYRFVSFLRQRLPLIEVGAQVVDVGAGSGAGGIVTALLRPGVSLTLTDISAKALRLARINAAYAQVPCQTLEGSGLDSVAGPIDLVVANPPFIAGWGGRLYRDGGGLYGGELSAQWTLAAAQRLSPGGAMLLYTGAAIVDGDDVLLRSLTRIARDQGCDLDYEEIDPDISGLDLKRPEYAQVERIAAVGAVLTKG